MRHGCRYVAKRPRELVAEDIATQVRPWLKAMRIMMLGVVPKSDCSVVWCPFSRVCVPARLAAVPAADRGGGC